MWRGTLMVIQARRLITGRSVADTAMGVTVSVVIPSRTWSQAMDSAFALQGYDEVILVRGSPVHPAHMRNLGAAEATGDILAFVDDDVRVEGSLAWFKGRPQEETFWGPREFRDATGDPETIATIGRINTTAKMGLGAASMGAFMVMRRRAFDTALGFDPERMSEDSSLGIALTLKGFAHYRSPHIVTFTRACPSYAQLMERFPEWRRFPRPTSLPMLRLTKRGQEMRVQKIGWT